MEITLREDTEERLIFSSDDMQSEDFINIFVVDGNEEKEPICMELDQLKAAVDAFVSIRDDWRKRELYLTELNK